jgi:hypothetical protein
MAWRGTGRGTNWLKIPRFWVQQQHFRVASVQAADLGLGSMLLVNDRPAVQIRSSAPTI